MAWHSIGKVSTASTVTGAVISSTSITCQTICFQQITANTGRIYICDRATPNLTTFVGVLATVPAPTAGSNELPLLTVRNETSPGCFNLNNIYILGSVASEGLIVSYVAT